MYLSKKEWGSTQTDMAFRVSCAILASGTEGKSGTKTGSSKHCHRSYQERQRQKLAHHAVERAHRHTTDMPGMRLVMHTFLTMMAFLMSLGMHMKRRQKQYWQEYCQQNQRRIKTSWRLFHGCKGSAIRETDKIKIPYSLIMTRKSNV